MTRIAVVDNNKLKEMDKKVYIQRLCPINRTGSDCIYFEGQKLLIDEHLCIGCGICVNAAPEAINIVNLPKALETDPIYRYGKNQFILYNLPIPIPGQVVGVLGRNGIGKSTALKIIAGTEQPNFGKDKPAVPAEVIQFFKGTEAQAYFTKLYGKKIKVAYKPQHVDAIPKVTTGKVMELLEKVNETGNLKQIIDQFELQEILDNNINEISGGELQRVAIAATLLKKANVYIFDEPTSYLDIKQRLKVAQIIKELAKENIAVVVIEHDLLVLDYMADLVHLMYGQPAVYGIVSHAQATKKAINAYLEGYLKEDNVRFRDKQITFHVKTVQEKRSMHKITSWSAMEKTQGKFSLTMAPGEIRRNEVVGVLGENGIGKTTFIKLLAGLNKPDGGTIHETVSISYKPQYLDTDSEELVMSYLSRAVEKYEHDLIEPLEIKELLLKQLNQLSGGELQRVSIAKALSMDCHLVLLDEPSAYLDVEQRLILSKVLKTFAEIRNLSVLVVDHDLLFVDYITDSLLVFTGKPAIHGITHGPLSLTQGMNMLLKEVHITIRRDEASARPRINKPASFKDREQKAAGNYYG